MTKAKDPYVMAAGRRKLAWSYLLEPTQWVYSEPVSTRMEDLAGVIKNVEWAIIDTLKPAMNRAAAMMLQDPSTFQGAQVVASIRKVAAEWARSMIDVGDPTGSLAARRLVAIAFGENHIPPEFWLSHLGQLVFFRDGFPNRPVSRTEARYIFGGVSRQAIDQAVATVWDVGSRYLVNADEREPGSGSRQPRFLTRESVYGRWNALRHVQEQRMLNYVRRIDVPEGL